MTVRLRPANKVDVPVIAELIRGLARYEKLEDQVEMTEELLAVAQLPLNSTHKPDRRVLTELVANRAQPEGPPR